MFRQMRRSRQELPEADVRAVLASPENTHGVLSVAGEGGYPYATPVSSSIEAQAARMRSTPTRGCVSSSSTRTMWTRSGTRPGIAVRSSSAGRFW